LRVKPPPLIIIYSFFPPPPLIDRPSKAVLRIRLFQPGPLAFEKIVTGNFQSPPLPLRPDFMNPCLFSSIPRLIAPHVLIPVFENRPLFFLVARRRVDYVFPCAPGIHPLTYTVFSPHGLVIGPLAKCSDPFSPRITTSHLFSRGKQGCVQ